MIILDGKKMSNLDELHREISEKLDFPDYYGCNTDALWDCLTGWVDLPLDLVWTDFDLVEKNLGADAALILKIFREADGVNVSITRSTDAKFPNGH